MATVVILHELSLPSSSKCKAGRHLIGSFHLDLKAETGWSFYRVTAATDDGIFSVLFQGSKVIDCCWDVNFFMKE